MLHAYIDESGQRGTSPNSSDHFVMSAVVLRASDEPVAERLLETLRSELGRNPDHALAWKHLKRHDERLHASKRIGAQTWLTTSSVVVCKRFLDDEADNDGRYLHTFRLLLERLSWLARDQNETMHLTLSHIVRFKLATLRAYEAELRSQATTIAWASLDPRGSDLVHPQQMEQLQLADLVASATAAAFEHDTFGSTETRYLRNLWPTVYRRGSAPATSYGLKILPLNDGTRAAHPWVAAL